MSDLGELAARLVQTESINPGLDPAGSGEGGVARIVAEWCARAGLDVEVEEAATERPNVVATARGSGGGRTLMLNAHMDTVGVADMAEPFSGRLDGDRLYGRGAYDMKGSLAASMLATAQAARLGLRGHVILTAVADEELASVGTTAIAAARRADGAIVTEPTECRLGVAHRGFVGFRVTVAGRAAHGSRPDLGIDAIARAGPALVRLGELDERLRTGPADPLLGTGSVHASTIRGGQEYSSYPASCELVGERRTVPGEMPADIERELAAIVGDIDATCELSLSRPPFAAREQDPFVELVARLACEPERIGLPFWTDAALLHEAGVPTVLYGPRGEGAHAEVEWVDLRSLEHCVDLYVRVAAELCA